MRAEEQQTYKRADESISLIAPHWWHFPWPGCIHLYSRLLQSTAPKILNLPLVSYCLITLHHSSWPFKIVYKMTPWKFSLPHNSYLVQRKHCVSVGPETLKVQAAPIQLPLAPLTEGQFNFLRHQSSYFTTLNTC
jgi:hypothetical protein